MHRDKGLGIEGLGYKGLPYKGLGGNGLSILYSTAFLAPFQIVRQFVSHNGQTIYPAYPAYHRYEGLSSPFKRRESKGYIQTSIGSIWSICGYKGLADIKVCMV